MPKRKSFQKDAKKPNKSLDPFLEKRGRGRPTHVERSTVTGRAENYRRIFAEVWPKLSTPLLEAKNEHEVISVFGKHAQPYTNNFMPRFAGAVLALVRDSLFPKRKNAQIGFMAESLAGMPEVSARRSRDICMEDRQLERAKSPHHILRKEFYVECSCGYKGPALNNACRKCEAEIDFTANILLGGSLG
jgi:hypothetical protein